MKAIGFRNFRKFENFPVIDMGDITIFVGGNNSGKSTTVKAIISVLTFLRNARFNASGNAKVLRDVCFYFNQNPYVHIGTFMRARYNKSKDNNIFFEIQLENYNFCIYLNGDDCDSKSTYARVDRIVLRDTKYLFEFDINFHEDNITLLFNKNTHVFENDEDYISFVEKINENESGDNEERLKRLAFEKFPIIDEQITFSLKLSEVYRLRRMVGGPLVSGIIYNASYIFSQRNGDFFYNEAENTKYAFLKYYMFRLSNQIDNLIWDKPLVEYIYAHAASQTILYNFSENNYLSKTVHEFAELREDKDYVAYDFVRRWMDLFEIGKGFAVESIGGEAHTFDIIDFDGKSVPLADKGMGTIQLMILLLRIAVIVNDRKKTFRYRNPVTVIVEEPEQNLHPQKQSQLIDFFTSISEEFNIKFIIETHSEYLVRKSQVMVASKHYESQEQLMKECPYRVYYFPANDIPYQMNYRPDGKFSNKFGSGFFDEASKLSFDLF